MMENPRVGVGIIIVDKRNVLLLRRKNVHGEGSWSTPGGHLDFSESPERCAIREAKEESNLDVDSVRFIAITNDYFEAENKHYITIWMITNYSSGQAVLSAPYESDAIEWFTWDKLPEPLFIPFQHLINGESYPKKALLRELNLDEIGY